MAHRVEVNHTKTSDRQAAEQFTLHVYLSIRSIAILSFSLPIRQMYTQQHLIPYTTTHLSFNLFLGTLSLMFRWNIT